MNSCGMTLCVFLLLAVEGTQGSELTINVRKNASVTLVCFLEEKLVMCYCPSYPQNCNTCTDLKTLTSPVIYQSHGDRYFKLSGLEHSNSGLYACHNPKSWKFGKKYHLHVFEDRDPNLVIGAIGQSIVISCGTEMDIMAASEKHWCRLDNADACQPDMIIYPGDRTRGDFKILDSHSSFSLEKHQLALSDTGTYRFTQIFQNETKVCKVELQVKNKTNFLQISPVRERPKPGEHFEIRCQYSQELQEFSKSWLCDSSECPETVKSVDDRFQSALVLTIDNAACSNIRSFQCVAKMSGDMAPDVESSVYWKPLNPDPKNVHIYLGSNRVVQVTALLYSLLNLICVKPQWEFDRGRLGSRYNDYHYYYYYNSHLSWCKVSQVSCLAMKDVKETRDKLTLQICVTPNDNGATYRCHSLRSTDVEIAVIAPPPPPPPPTRRTVPTMIIPSYPNVGIIIVVTGTILFLIILCVTFTQWKGKRLRERWFKWFARRTPLAAVDIHANTYANSVAHYYSAHGRQGGGGNKENSSSSDEEFEELPVRPETSSSVMPEETVYVTVKPRGSAQNDLGRKSEMGETNTDKVVAKQCEDEDDEDEVTYTHVIIKPKHRLE